MKDAKEFHGKTLDEAIRTACEFYGVEREKLEIEIVNDSKMGIFGLVNVKKACVRASLVSTAAFLEDLTETLTQPDQLATSPGSSDKQLGKAVKASGPGKTDKAKALKTSKTPSKTAKPSAPKTAPAEGDKPSKEDGAKTAKPAQTKQNQERISGGQDAAVAQQQEGANEAKAEVDDDGVEKSKTEARPQKKERPQRRQEPRPRRGRNNERTSSDGDGAADECTENGEGFALADLASLNQEELHAMIHDVVNRLVSSIIGEVPLTIAIDEGHIRVKVDCDEDARILVGREGQTLASVQYIASRILSGKLNGAVRLHIDTGNYKENQDARLTSLAQALAEKLRKTGRTQSTRPLSAYQRRIVHLALEGEEDIQTSSKGEGPQRRVLIHFKRNRNQRGGPQASEPGSAEDGQETSALKDGNGKADAGAVTDNGAESGVAMTAFSETETTVEETASK